MNEEIISEQLKILHEKSKEDGADIVQLTNSMAELLKASAQVKTSEAKKDAPQSVKVSK